MTVAKRAFIIGMLGPALQAIGFLWLAIHMALSHWSQPFGPRHLMYEPGVLVRFVGWLLTLV